MTTYTIKRTGLAPLTFKGDRLASVSGQYLFGRENNRWWELEVYRASNDEFVLRVSYLTIWQGELPHHEVCVCDSPKQLARSLSDYRGFVSTVRMGLDEEAMKKGHALDRQLRHLVTEIFDELGSEFSEDIEDLGKEGEGTE